MTHTALRNERLVATARRDLALQLANALGLENLGPGMAPAATPA
jgi:hypothetical protein